MANKKIRIRPEGSNNYADVLHPETTASQVIEETNKKFMTDAERTKLNGLPSTAFNHVYTGSVTVDPNASQEPYILTQHANCPESGYWHIQTLFRTSLTGSRTQIATKYDAGDEMYLRHFVNSTWSTWKRIWHSGNMQSSVLTDKVTSDKWRWVIENGIISLEKVVE